MAESSVVSDVDNDPLRIVRRWYLVAILGSYFGNTMANLAIAFVVYDRSRSVLLTVLVSVASGLPLVALSPVATKVVPRFGTAMTFGLASSALGVLALIPAVLTVVGELDVGTLLVWELLNGVIVGLTSPAMPMLTRRLAPPTAVPEYNAKFNRSKGIAMLSGLVAGGFVLAMLGPAWIFVFDAISFAGTAVIALRWRKQLDTESQPQESLRDGFEFVIQSAGVRSAFIACAFFVMLVGPLVSILPAVAREVSDSPHLLSWYMASLTIGGVFVAFVVHQLHKRETWSVVGRTCFAISGIGLIALASIPRRQDDIVLVVALTVVALIPIGFAYNIVISVLASLVQLGTPADQRGPVFTAWAVVMGVLAPVGGFAMGFVADQFSVGWALVSLGVAMLLVTILGTSVRLFRTLDGLDSSAPVKKQRESGSLPEPHHLHGHFATFGQTHF